MIDLFRGSTLLQGLLEIFQPGGVSEMIRDQLGISKYERLKLVTLYIRQQIWNLPHYRMNRSLHRFSIASVSALKSVKVVQGRNVIELLRKASNFITHSAK